MLFASHPRGPRFHRQTRTNEYAFRFARHGEEALAVLAEDPAIDLGHSTSTCRSLTS